MKTDEEGYGIKIRKLDKQEKKLENQLHGMIDHKKSYEKIQKLNKEIKEIKREIRELMHKRRNLRITHDNPETVEQEIEAWDRLHKKVEKNLWFI